MPNNGSYLTAAYVVAAVILVLFSCKLWKDSRKS